MEYLGRTDFVQVPPKGIQKYKFEQLARLAETLTKQESMELNRPVVQKTPDVAVDEAQAALPTLEVEKVRTGDINDALGDLMGDAPACPTCGHITVRNGSCYKCLNCGDSLGCS